MPPYIKRDAALPGTGGRHLFVGRLMWGCSMVKLCTCGCLACRAGAPGSIPTGWKGLAGGGAGRK